MSELNFICNPYESASRLVYSSCVMYPRKNDKILWGMGIPQLEVDFLSNIHARNSLRCKIVESLSRSTMAWPILCLFFFQSLPAQMDEFKLLLNNFGCKSSHIFIGMSETWSNHSNEILYVPPGFHIVPNSR